MDVEWNGKWDVRGVWTCIEEREEGEAAAIY